MLQRLRDLVLDQFEKIAWSHRSHAGIVHRQIWGCLSSLEPHHRHHFRRALGASERIVFEMCCPQVWSGTYLEPYLQSLSVADLRRIYSIVLSLFTVLVSSRIPEEREALNQALKQLRLDSEIVDETVQSLQDLNTDDPRQLSRSTRGLMERILGVEWHPLVCGAYVIFVEAEWQQFPVPEGL